MEKLTLSQLKILAAMLVDMSERIDPKQAGKKKCFDLEKLIADEPWKEGMAKHLYGKR